MIDFKLILRRFLPDGDGATIDSLLSSTTDHGDRTSASSGAYGSKADVPILANGAAVLLLSREFDALHYGRSVGMEFASPIDAAMHYIETGDAAGIAPSPFFDPHAYRTAYPDLVGYRPTTLHHYILFGKKEGRSTQAERSSPLALPDGLDLSMLVESEFFDVEAYKKDAGLVSASAEEAARHYVIEGEKAGIPASEKFNARYYEKTYEDVAGYKPSLLHHFLMFGRKEGRLGSRPCMLVRGERVISAERETILLCLHELTITGAPVLGWNLVRALGTKFNVIVATINDGKLRDSFKKECCAILIVDSQRHWSFTRQIDAETRSLLLPEFAIDLAIVNGANAWPLADMCRDANIPVVALVHEFASIYEEACLRSLLAADRVVFSTPVTLEAVYQAGLVHSPLQHCEIVAQGKCDVPRSEEDPSRWTEVEHLFEDGVFTVIGCGHVERRKGVDLFVATATSVARSWGRERTRFVWIGGGFDPTSGDSESFWAREVVRQTGLQDIIHFHPPMASADLENVYRSADALFLSSRLDPLPNVAIDALAGGLPVVCFDKGNGIASYLLERGKLANLVVPYLDIGEAGKALLRIASDDEFRLEASSEARDLAVSEFAFERYVDRLEPIFRQAQASAHQEQADIQTLLDVRGVEPDILGGAVGSVSTYEELVARYVRYSETGIIQEFEATRRPRSGFNPHAYAEKMRQAGERGNSLANWIRAGRPEGYWTYPVVDLTAIEAPLPVTSLSCAIHIHIHYPELLPDILDRLQQNVARFDIFISTTSVEKKTIIEKAIEGCSRSVRLRVVPNVGRDIASFYCSFGHELRAYDVVGHLHGKKSPHVASAQRASELSLIDVWNTMLMENLAGGLIPAVDRIISIFETNERLGLVFPEDAHCCGWGKNYSEAVAMAERIGISTDLPKSIEFPVGNMFFARSGALAPLFEADLRYEEFPSEPVGIDGTVLHALERMTPFVAEQQGYGWLCSSVSGVRR